MGRFFVQLCLGRSGGVSSSELSASEEDMILLDFLMRRPLPVSFSDSFFDLFPCVNQIASAMAT